MQRRRDVASVAETWTGEACRSDRVRACLPGLALWLGPAPTVVIRIYNYPQGRQEPVLVSGGDSRILLAQLFSSTLSPIRLSVLFFHPTIASRFAEHERLQPVASLVLRRVRAGCMSFLPARLSILPKQ